MPAHSQPPALPLRAVMARAAGLLVRNLSIVVPGLVAGFFSGIVAATLTSTTDDVNVASLALQTAVLIAETIATILSIAYTTGMAEAAWLRGRARFADGAQAFRREGPHVFVALVILAVFGTLAALAVPFTFGLSVVVLAFFCVYAMPAAVVGRRSGVRAIVESAEIAVERALPTSLMIVGIAIIVVVVGQLAALLDAVPYVGPIVRQVVVQTTIVYAMLVIVGEYRQLRLP
jgi:hypothetical protein